MSADVGSIIEGYAAAGLACFPLHGVRDGMCTCGRPAGNGPGDCHSPAKHPLLGLAHRKDDPRRDTCKGECGLLGHGLYDATTDPDQLARWLADHPGANWGVRPAEGVVVIDVDPRNGGDVTLQKLQDRHGELPPTLTATTGSGGRHIWLSYHGPARGKIGEGLDVKTNKGYLVAPPSVHISGGTYTWTDMRPAAYAPAWVKALLNPPIVRRPIRPGGHADLDRLVRFVGESVEGQRNNRLYWAACRAREQSLDPAPLIDAAVAVGVTHGAAVATVESAFRAPIRTRRSTTAQEFMAGKQATR